MEAPVSAIGGAQRRLQEGMLPAVPGAAESQVIGIPGLTSGYSHENVAAGLEGDGNNGN